MAMMRRIARLLGFDAEMEQAAVISLYGHAAVLIVPLALSLLGLLQPKPETILEPETIDVQLVREITAAPPAPKPAAKPKPAAAEPAAAKPEPPKPKPAPPPPKPEPPPPQAAAMPPPPPEAPVILPDKTKPPEKKPEPEEKPVAKPTPPEKKPEPRKPEEDFASLLDEVLDERPAEKAKPATTAALPADAAAPKTSSQAEIAMTSAQKDSIKKQLKDFWAYEPGTANPEKYRPLIRVTLAPDCTVKKSEILEKEKMSDPTFRAVANTARAAPLKAGKIVVPNGDCADFPILDLEFDLAGAIYGTY